MTIQTTLRAASPALVSRLSPWPGLLMLLLIACGSPGSEKKAAQESEGASPYPNFIVIDIDSVRADRVRAVRDGAPVAPTLDRLSREGAYFTGLISQSGWTMPAISSLLTGAWPRLLQAKLGGLKPFVDEGPHLPQILSLYGYQTTAFWGSTAPGGFDAIKAMFQENHRADPPWDYTYGAEVNQWLSTEAKEPFFLFVHDMDIFNPTPLPPDDQLHIYGEAHPLCGVRNQPREPTQLFGSLMAKDGLESAAAHMIGHNDGTLHYYDATVASILANVTERGLDDNTVIILLSDHGNDLLDHHVLGHGPTFDTNLHVPLIIVDPTLTGPGQEHPQTIQTIDIAPTILARAGIPVAERMIGQSLLPLLGQAEGSYEERPVYSMTSQFNASLRKGRYKFMRWQYRRDDLPEGPMKRPTPETSDVLFDLEADPGELTDIAAANPEIVAEYQGLLDAWLELQTHHRGKGLAQPVDPAFKEKLQRDGYWELLDPDDKAAAVPGE